MSDIKEPGVSGFAKDDEPRTGTALAETGLVGAGDTGLEGLQSQEFQTPGLRIIQQNSPQLVRNAPEYDPDARPGNILNTATGENWDGQAGLEVVIFAKDYHYGEWIPRNPDGSGGGFRGMHLPNEPLVTRLLQEHGRFKKLPWTNSDGENVELAETGQLYVYYAPEPLGAENAQPAYISLSSTNMPVYQRWLSRHSGWKYRQPDNSMKEAKLWAYIWKLTTVAQSRGTQNWFIFKLEPVGGKPLELLTAVRDKALFKMSEDMFGQYRAGLIKAAQTDREPDSDYVPM